jgi:hypothetical protein
MHARGPLHLIEQDLAESSHDAWAGDGLEALEAYLAKHLAFLDYLGDDAAFLDDAAPA